MQRWKRLSLGMGIFVLIVGLYGMSQEICIPALFKGMTAQRCPSTKVVPELAVAIHNIRRGETANINFQLDGRFLSGDQQFENSGSIRNFTSKLSLEDDNGDITQIDLTAVEGEPHRYTFTTPLVDDGHYAFVAESKSAYGVTKTRVPVDLFANAIGHLITDRSLYEPGQTIKSRILLMNARKLNPLSNRIGQWRLIAPDGTILIEKERRTEAWGVSAVDFHLSTNAPEGTWTVEFESGDLTLTHAVKVEPFTLPRFTVTSKTDQTHYRPGDKPIIEGVATFSSGAPVQKATVKVKWSMENDTSGWMPPISWNDEKTIKTQLKTDSSGKFKLELPKIPDDLVGQAAVKVLFKVTDDAGEVISNQTKVKLSEDAIQLDALTEWGGLSEGVNNRLFIRVATPDDKPLPNHHINVKRSWDNTDGGIETQTDDNGIALVQIDPGKPINVVIPPMPYRLPPPKDPVVFASAQHVSNGKPVSIADQLSFQKFESKLDSCRRFTANGTRGTVVDLVLFVSSNGSILASRSENPASNCIAKALKNIKLQADKSRLVKVAFKLQGSPHPYPSIYFWENQQSPWDNDWKELQFDARTCLKKYSPNQASIDLSWYTKSNSKAPTIGISGSKGMTSSEENCIVNKMRAARSTKATSQTILGGLTLSFEGYRPSSQSQRPTATTYLGYELEVDAEGLGSSKLQLKTKPVPDLRIRTVPSLTSAGQTVSVEFIRGPEFGQDLPKRISITHPDGEVTQHLLDSTTRKAQFKVPEKEGWYTTELFNTTGHFYVPPSQILKVDLNTSTKSYRPGTRVSLNIDVTANGEPVKSAVGLFGVDKSLGELSPLATAEEFTESLEFIAESKSSADALGLSAAALQHGLLSGQNAQLAAMTLIRSTPTLADKDNRQTVYGSTDLQPMQTLTDSFFSILDELHKQVLKWESNAQPHEQFKPETVLTLWNNAIDTCQSKDHSCTDLYGRPLKISMLPSQYQAMVAPNALALDGSRLPEDMVNWSNWIKENER